ncbi:MAG: hypothetical protein Kow00121_40390 [Elainellaceae cyanobacterium]
MTVLKEHPQANCERIMLESLLEERYKIIAVLGVGGFGQTYLAEDTQHGSGQRCVIKQFKPTLQDPQFLATARRLFDSEAATLKRLGQHPQIPNFLEFFEEDGEFYLVQEFIEGHSLTYEFASVGKFDEGKAIALLQDALGILEFVHTNQVIHRDIKPGNLIRRQRDGKIILIDFGAVKELQTQLNTQLRQQTGQTGFTVSIGTQGYSPSEQLAGQPRFCSDIYALGVTVIQAITKLHPTQLPVNPDTGELVWRDYVAVSPGFADILEGMVRYHFNQRFQSATQVLEALQQLSESAIDPTEIVPAEIRFDRLSETRLPVQQADNSEVVRVSKPASRLLFWRKSARVVAIASLVMSSLVLGIRQLGGLEPLELAAYDHMVRMRPAAEPDPRLLIVEITEADLQALQRPTPSDRDLAQVIRNLTQYQPSVIGLDLHRELPQEPGHADLMQQLQDSQVIPIFKLGNDGIEIPPPSGISLNQAGFSDIPVDPDGIIRRNLMFAAVAGASYTSFSTQVTLRYLEQQGITPQSSPEQSNFMQLNGSMFVPLQPDSGGYHHGDTGGYQILLDYRSPTSPARLVSFTDVLQGELEAAWVRDKIILIGTTAASSKDLFTTPYSAGQVTDHTMPGIVLHAQMVSQILHQALNQRSPFWFFAEWAEVVWIIGWAIAGGAVAWLIRQPLWLGAGTLGLLLSLGGFSMGLFLWHGWVPVVAPVLSLLLTSVAIVSYRAAQEPSQ